MRRTLAADPESPARARAALDELDGRIGADVLERARVVLSEVVTNAVAYGGGSHVTLELWCADGALEFVVRDGGAGFTPDPNPSPQDEPGGLGLQLVDMIADAWACGSEGGSWVWVSVAPSEPESEPDPPEDPATGLLNLRMLVDAIKNVALVALDTNGQIASWGDPAERLTGYSAEEVLGRRLSDLYSPSVGSALARDLESAAVTGGEAHERWLRQKAGSLIFVSILVAPIADRSGVVRGFSALISDMTSRRERERRRESVIRELRQLSLTDELTGLPNRRRWGEELERELDRAQRSGRTLSLAMIDIDGFKGYNDANGHLAGDDLLRDVARAWSAALRTTDLLARYGGDEFAVILPDCPPEEALEVIGRLSKATPPPVGSSAGIASSDGSEAADAVVNRADAALYRSKREGRGVLLAASG